MIPTQTFFCVHGKVHEPQTDGREWSWLPCWRCRPWRMAEAWLRGLFLAKPEQAEPEADEPEEDTDCPYCAAEAGEPCNCASIYGDPDYEYDFAREQELERD